MIYKLE